MHFRCLRSRSQGKLTPQGLGKRSQGRRPHRLLHPAVQRADVEALALRQLQQHLCRGREIAGQETKALPRVRPLLAPSTAWQGTIVPCGQGCMQALA